MEREIEENYQNPFCDDCNSEYWAAEILRLYPGSEWARLIEDPEFQDEAEIIREAQREEYEAFLNRYYLKDYQQVLLDIDEVLARDSANAFECKHRLLRTQCVGGLTSYSGERTPYFEALASVVSDCPDTEEAAFAQDLMRKLGVSLGDDPTPKEVEETEEQSEFAIQPDNEHYLAIFIPVGRGNGDQVKAKVADFNNSFFGSKRLKVTSNLLDRSTQVVLVKSFPNMREGMDYYTVFTGNREGLIEVNSSGYEMVLISNENYVSLFKNKNVIGYAQFFAQQYLSGQ